MQLGSHLGSRGRHRGPQLPCRDLGTASRFSAGPRRLRNPSWVTMKMPSFPGPRSLLVVPSRNRLLTLRVRLGCFAAAALRPSAEREAGGGVLRGACLVGPAAARGEAGQGVWFTLGLGRRCVRDVPTGAVCAPVFTLRVSGVNARISETHGSPGWGWGRGLLRRGAGARTGLGETPAVSRRRAPRRGVRMGPSLSAVPAPPALRRGSSTAQDPSSQATRCWRHLCPAPSASARVCGCCH